MSCNRVGNNDLPASYYSTCYKFSTTNLGVFQYLGSEIRKQIKLKSALKEYIYNSE